MSVREEYLGLWFDLAFPGEHKTIDKEELKAWFLQYADIENFHLNLEYDFSSELCLIVKSSWEECDLLYWTRGRAADFEGDFKIPTLEELVEAYEDADLTAQNEEFMKILTGYLHNVLEDAQEFQLRKFSAYVHTEVPNGYVVYKK